MNEPVAIIIGAGRGIGRAIAIELAVTHRLALLARTASDLEETRRLTGEGLVLPTDVAHPAQVQQALTKTLEAFGRVDVVVNCAGYAPVLSMDQITTRDWNEILDANLSSVFHLCKAAWPALKVRGGVIVNISSRASRDPFPGLGAYGAAKAGVNLLSLALAREGEAHNIRVHALALGSVETGMFRQILTEAQFPREKTLSPQDVAKVVAQCVHGSLRYTSGEVIALHKTQ